MATPTGGRLRLLLPWLLVAAGVAAAFATGCLIQAATSAFGPAIARAEEMGPQARVQEVRVAGLEAGQLIVGDREVATISMPAAGFSGYERALIVADRINRNIAQGSASSDFRAQRNSHPVIRTTGGNNILTVTSDDARAAGVAPEALADRWAADLRQALGGAALEDQAAATPVASSQAPSSTQWRPSERYDDKYVPIISLLQGTRLGVARVNGPRSRVRLTQAVVQFSIDFGSFLEIDIYVPVSTREPGRTLSRIQGVGVTGLGDLRL
ncbi:MAG: hypothetical protein ACYC63_05185 [Armatimonadota bacterium]